MLVMVYHQGSPLGEAEIYPQNEKFDAMESCKKEIRITDFSPPSERCPPLAVLHTVASCGLCFKMEAKPPQAHELPLFALYGACLRENKTAIVQLGEEELHLVAMPTRNKLKPFPCFWGFIVYPRLYGACLNMLNLRCLGIVFDLDETLIVANTMRSFEDRIEALQRRISTELDSQRIVGMLAEVKRYQDDKSILKQYVDGDQVSENGKVVKVQSEIVPPMLDSHQSIIRPIIRLNDRNIILTRINPLIRDTSVLVRLRPAWDELRSYLTAKGRKRFEVYVCTMAERDYALEMWRLLDPESNLINSKELLDRIVCVKSGSKKSLLNVFQYGICHPKMAMVIDDRLKVWDDKDQPRVHVVPAYAPYYAPQAEASNAVPVLCVARNVACNVRGGFFKEFDEGLLQRMSCVVYEDDLSVMPSAPDVSSYLNSEQESSISLGSKDLPVSENLADSEVERKIKSGNSFAQLPPVPAVSNPDPVLQPSQFALVAPSNILAHQSSQFALGNQHAGASQKTSGPVIPSESSLQNSPGREEGEVPESELDPDTRRRLLILQHGQDTREQTATDPPFPLRPSLHMPTPPVQLHGSWPPIEEEMSPKQPVRVRSEFLLEQENLSAQLHYPPFYATMNGPIPSYKSLYESQRSLKEVHIRDDRLRKSHSPHASFDEVHHGFSHGPLNTRDLHVESCQNDSENPTSPLLALQDISMKIGEKLNFKSLVNAGMDLQFSFEVWFVGQKIGEGTGTTRRNAQLLAAHESLQNLANKYLSSIPLELRHLPADPDKISCRNDNGFINDPVSSFGYVGSSRQDIPIASTSEHSRFSDQRSAGSQRPSSVSSLKEWCMMEGLNLVFQEQPSLSVNSSSNGKVYAQVEVSGQVVGKGIGSNWEEAKQQAAQEALANLKSPTFPQRNPRRLSSPRSSHTSSVKRMKRDFARGFSRAPSTRYSKNGPPVS